MLKSDSLIYLWNQIHKNKIVIVTDFKNRIQFSNFFPFLLYCAKQKKINLLCYVENILKKLKISKF